MRLHARLRCLTLVVLATVLEARAESPVSPPAAAPSRVQRFVLGQEGGWDYLSYDARGHRVFIGRSTRVWAIDADRGTVSGEIPGTDGVHGIALAPGLNKGFTSDGRSNTVTVFDLDTLQVRRKIALTGVQPDAILYDPASRHVLSFNAKTRDVSVIDAALEREVARIPLPGTPEFAVADARGLVYANIESNGSVVVIDTKRSRVLKTWSLGDCKEPTGLALDRADALLFSTCQNGVMVALSTRNGKVAARLAIDAGPDAAAFDPALKQVYAANGRSGTLSVYRVESPTRFRRLPTIETQTGARTMALDPAGHRIFLAAAEFGAPPPPTVEQPHPRPSMVPDSFTILEISPPTH